MSKDISDRLYKFTLRIIELVRSLSSELVAREIGKQLIRSGSSIAANYEEATVGFSKDDFTYKLAIAFKEAKETNFWLRLLQDAKIVKPGLLELLIEESIEISNILGKSVKTAKGRK